MGASLAASRIVSKRSYQEAVDIWELYCMTYYYRNCAGQNIQMKPPEPLAFDKQLKEVHMCVTEQLTSLLKSLINSSHCEQSKENPSPESFSLSVEKSSISHPQAGEGVYLCGSAVPGTVIMIHPGLVYLPTYIRKMPNYPWIDKDNTYLMSRYDGCILDPKGMNVTVQTSNGSSVPHPYALGHKVNHPPAGGKPNIMPFSYDFQETFPEELLTLVPNRYYRQPGFLFKTSAVMRSVVYVATDHVCNEELFVNYRLNPACKLPDWYTPVDSKEDSRRWSS